MEKAKQLEKIQLEYDLFEVDEDITLGRVFTMISTNTEEVDVARSLIDLEKRRNRRRRFISSVLGKHAERFGYLDSWYYDMDDSYLDKKSVVLDKYYSQLNDFWSALNDNNTQEQKTEVIDLLLKKKDNVLKRVQMVRSLKDLLLLIILIRLMSGLKVL